MTACDTSVMLPWNPGDAPEFEAIVCGPMYIPWSQIPGCTCNLLLLAIGCVGTLICMHVTRGKIKISSKKDSVIVYRIRNYSTSRKAKKQGEMPLTRLSPIPFLKCRIV